MIKKFLVAALTAVVFASSAEALSVKHDFTAFVGPFNASTAEFEYTLTKKSYAVRSVVRTNGTFGFLYPFEANYYTGGSIEGDRLETSAYRYTSQSRFNKRSKVMIYNEDGQPVLPSAAKTAGKRKKKSKPRPTAKTPPTCKPCWPPLPGNTTKWAFAIRGFRFLTANAVSTPFSATKEKKR